MLRQFPKSNTSWSLPRCNTCHAGLVSQGPSRNLPRNFKIPERSEGRCSVRPGSTKPDPQDPSMFCFVRCPQAQSRKLPGPRNSSKFSEAPASETGAPQSRVPYFFLKSTVGGQGRWETVYICQATLARRPEAPTRIFQETSKSWKVSGRTENGIEPRGPDRHDCGPRLLQTSVDRGPR